MTSSDAVVTSRPRELWVDNLRVLVVAGVIVVHAATGYITGVADWYYDELTSSAVWSTALAFPAVAGALFGLGPLFLIAGWLSPRSLAHRGPGGFAGSRLLRSVSCDSSRRSSPSPWRTPDCARYAPRQPRGARCGSGGSSSSPR
jgi:glucans biosynthesis protein C